MVSFMHHWALHYFIEAAGLLGKEEDVKNYSALANRVKAACEEQLWDGDWYLRGFTRKGRKIGTREEVEGRLFLNAQTWAVYSGVASPERARKSMDAVEAHLYSPFGLHLLWPAYSQPDDDIGYVTRVYKGIKENGAIFSHPNPWAVIAETLLGRGSRAMKFYDAMLPCLQNDRIETRQAEPYSYCQFIMGKDHTAHGRARHPWLTGSAGWFYTAATRYMLGIRTSLEGLIIDPCIPADWPGFEVKRRWRGADFHIVVKNPRGVEKGVASVTLDSQSQAGPSPPQPRNTTHRVEVILG
jgi:N,N'-diacetylchitobiose phosphorylase